MIFANYYNSLDVGQEATDKRLKRSIDIDLFQENLEHKIRFQNLPSSKVLKTCQTFHRSLEELYSRVRNNQELNSLHKN